MFDLRQKELRTKDDSDDRIHEARLHSVVWSHNQCERLVHTSALFKGEVHPEIKLVLIGVEK